MRVEAVSGAKQRWGFWVSHLLISLPGYGGNGKPQKPGKPPSVWYLLICLLPPSRRSLLTPSCPVSPGLNGAFPGAGVQPGKALVLRSMGIAEGVADMGARA